MPCSPMNFFWQTKAKESDTIPDNLKVTFRCFDATDTSKTTESNDCTLGSILHQKGMQFSTFPSEICMTGAELKFFDVLPSQIDIGNTFVMSPDEGEEKIFEIVDFNMNDQPNVDVEESAARVNRIKRNDVIGLRLRYIRAKKKRKNPPSKSDKRMDREEEQSEMKRGTGEIVQREPSPTASPKSAVGSAEMAFKSELTLFQQGKSPVASPKSNTGPIDVKKTALLDPRQSERSPLVSPRETNSTSPDTMSAGKIENEATPSLSPDILLSIFSVVQPAKNPTARDYKWVEMSFWIVDSMSTQMKYDYERRFRCSVPHEPILTRTNYKDFLQEISLAFRLLQICFNTQWTRVSMMKKIELDLHMRIKSMVEKSILAKKK